MLADGVMRAPRGRARVQAWCIQGTAAASDCWRRECLALADTSISVRIEGLAPRTLLQVRASVELPSGSLWESHAWFISDADGVIDLNTASPLDGTYRGVDPNGLVWSLRHDPTSPPKLGGKRFLNEGLQPYDIAIEVLDVDGVQLARRAMTREAVAPGVRRVEVRESGIHGTLFMPPGHADLIVVNLPGSDGGVPEQLSALFASHGFASLALGYFAVAGSELPQHLSAIRLEYFEDTFAWIRSHPELGSAAIILSGTSRGGELALLLASRNPVVAGVIAWVPSGHVHGGYPGWSVRR